VWLTPRAGCFNPGNDPVRLVWEVGWAQGQVWTDAEDLLPAGIRSPDRPARSESLCRVSYPGLLNLYIYIYIYIYNEMQSEPTRSSFSVVFLGSRVN
jgi:hypothetical protein